MTTCHCCSRRSAEFCSCVFSTCRRCLLWDMLTMLWFAIKGRGGKGAELKFRVCVQNRPDVEPELMALKAVCGPDDDGNPCLTVMMPNEDY